MTSDDSTSPLATEDWLKHIELLDRMASEHFKIIFSGRNKMVKCDHGFYFFLALCPSDTAVQAKAGYEGVGVSRTASADGAHVARGPIQPDTLNIAASGREVVGPTNKTSVDQAHVVAASGTYRSTPTKRISQRTVTDTYSNTDSAAHGHHQ